VADGVFEQYPIASWQAPGFDAVSFAVVSISEQGGARIVPHERPYRDGAKLDDAGAKPRRWTLQAFFDTIDEGAESGVPSYPQALRRLIRSFSSRSTGDLVLPTVGKVRARLDDYTRRETFEERDSAVLDLVFIEDNEDALDVAALSPPTVTATLARLAEQTQFTAGRNGDWSEDVASLAEVASDIEALLLAPGRAVADVNARITAHRHAIERVTSAFDQASRDTGGLFTQPRGSELERQLAILLDLEARAPAERSASRPRTKAFLIDVERTSLFDIAARFEQDAAELLELNAGAVADPFNVTRGQSVSIFESTPR
jgi:prophage DNA circulation protein